MHYEELRVLFGNSPAVRLLRANHAPLILSFLFREFKETGQLILSNPYLVSQLADFLETLSLAEAGADPDEGLIEDHVTRARRYIDDWCSEGSRFLRKFPDETGEPVHELTAETEKVFQWIESLRKKEFVGTESRFLDIFAKLRDLIENSHEDPEAKIAALEARKQAIEAEIREIETTGRVDTFSDTQIKERFHDVSKLARELNSDFKEVEQNFKEITRRIYEQQMQADITAGRILGFALDAAEKLKESDQGRSFYAFWFFLIAPERQDELSRLIDQAYALLEERKIEASDAFLRNIKRYLHQAGQKVVASNHRLADRLSHVLTEKNILDRQRAAGLIAAIKRAAVERAGTGFTDKAFVSIEGDPRVSLSMDRPLGEPVRESVFANQPDELGGEDEKPLDIGALFNRFAIDRERLADNVRSLLKGQSQVTLEQVVDHFGLTRGIAEVVTYLTIASEGSDHLIDDHDRVTLRIDDDDRARTVSLPRVIFVNSDVKASERAYGTD